jgi:hypothetical protein
MGKVFCSFVETLAYRAARMIYIFQVSKNFVRKTITEEPWDGAFNFLLLGVH